MCDKVNVGQAFASMDVTQQNFTELYQQENTHRLEAGVSLANMLVMIPLLTILALYLVIPFIVEAFGQLSTTIAGMGV